MDVYSTEEEQIAAIKKYIEENGLKILLTLIVVIGGYFGFTGWQSSVQSQKEEASVVYTEITELVQGSQIQGEDKAAFDTALARLQEKYPASIYKQYAELFNAKVAVENNDLDAAAQSLQAVIDAKFSEELVELATLRLAEVEFSRNNHEQALKLLNTKAVALVAQFEELKGDIYFDQDKKSDALIAYKKAEAALGEENSYSTRVLGMKISSLDTSNSSKIFPVAGTQTPAVESEEK